MARPRKKKRTQPPANANPTTKPGARPPKSMVIRMGAGEVGTSVSQLTQDFRHVMEPDTASRLKERKANRLKDYTAMAGPLGVTHLFLFSRSKSGNVHLRVALTPRGPTLSFRVDNYALAKDIAKSQKRPRGSEQEYQNAPLLVMNNFTTPTSDVNPKDHISKQLESLTTTVFQSIFPPISPQTIPVSSIRRILLLNRESKSTNPYTYSLRHYAITTRPTGVSKRVRRIDPTSSLQLKQKSHSVIPNLGNLEDAADYLLSPAAAGGYTSASETELDTDAEVEILETSATKVLSRKQRDKLAAQRAQQQKQDHEQQQQQQQQQQNQENPVDPATRPPPTPRPHQRTTTSKHAVKLVELGPRMTLRLIKVEEGICEGKVMWNSFVSKSTAEEKELDERWSTRRKAKEERRQVQRENVERKREVKRNTKLNAGGDGQTTAKGMGEGGEGAEESDDDDVEWDSDEVEGMLEDEANGLVGEGETDEDDDDDEDEMEVDGDGGTAVNQ